jgi:hypothetical protein
MDDKGGRAREDENGTRFASQITRNVLSSATTYHKKQHSKSRIGDDHFYHAKNIELLVVIVIPQREKRFVSAKMMITRHE